jgi:hypothetical protein
MKPTLLYLIGWGPRRTPSTPVVRACVVPPPRWLGEVMCPGSRGRAAQAPSTRQRAWGRKPDARRQSWRAGRGREGEVEHVDGTECGLTGLGGGGRGWGEGVDEESMAWIWSVSEVVVAPWENEARTGIRIQGLTFEDCIVARSMSNAHDTLPTYLPSFLPSFH